MQVLNCKIAGLKIIQLKLLGDSRGFFVERFNAKTFAKAGLPTQFIQDNHSRSAAGILRGLHYQHNPAQGKLVGVIRGRVWDVAVDIRPHSTTFGQYHAIELTGDNGMLFWISPGFAHGFCVLGDEPVDMLYKVTAPYNSEGEGGIRFNDPQLGIPWPLEQPIISGRDKNLPSWNGYRSVAPKWEGMNGCSVIMVSYHTGPVLFTAIKTVLKQKQLAEIIVVDNGNSLEVLAHLQQMTLTEPRLSILTGHGNIGFARGCNLGAVRATGEYLLLLNPDCLLPPDAIGDMIAAFGTIPGTMLAGCRLENPDGSEQRGGRRRLLTPMSALGEALGVIPGLERLLQTRRLYQHHVPMPEAPFEVPAISGAFMFQKRSDYNQLQGLDEDFFLHVEDLDYCMRVHNAGGKVICVPSVRVTHLLGSSGQKSLRFIEWQKAKGFRRYFDKHFRGKYLPGFLTLVHVAILARFAFKITFGSLENWLPSRWAQRKNLIARRLMVLASGVTELPSSPKLNGKTVLVTGATGQVGLCTMRRLLASGANVLGLSRGNAIPFRYERLQWLKGDLSNKTFTFSDYHPDVIVHCVPLWRPLSVINALTTSGAKRIIVFSSTSVFAKALSKNEFEKELVRNLTQAETELTNHCQANGIALTILRPTLIYGVGLDENVTTLAKFIRRFKFFPVYPPAFGRRQPVHADDLAIAVLQAMENEKTYGKSYNVSGGEIITYSGMLERLFELFNYPPNIVRTTLLPFALDTIGRLLRKKDINGEIARRMNDDLIFFHDDATRDFGFTPRPFLSGGMRDLEGF